MKGIILAAGKGTRLYPMTHTTCKPLLPVYDKPLIYYPLSVLMQAGINEVMIIIPPDEEHNFAALLGDGSHLGMKISYAVQKVARGIADALLIGKDFIGDDSVCLVLGDNLFYQPQLSEILKKAGSFQQGAVVFGYYVDDPRPFGVVEFDENGKAISIEEKPKKPKSNYIIPGLYFYDSQVIEIAEHLTPSARGELEITDVNLEYLRREQLSVSPLDNDFVWMDAGTADSLLDTSIQVKNIQQETGRYVGCIEELAYQEGWISQEAVHALGDELKMTLYGQYLLCL
jgi:glucose-1-phosphate thymidylyltransferase